MEQADSTREEYTIPKKSRYLNEPFFIALTIILPFIAITIWLIASGSIEFFQEIAAVWGVWVGTVLGYYFGSRPVETLIRRVETLMDDYDDSSEDYERQLDEADTALNDLQAKYDKAVKDIQYIVLKYPKMLDNEVTERLKKEYEVLV